MTKKMITFWGVLLAVIACPASAEDTYSFAVNGSWANPVIIGVTTDGTYGYDFDIDNTTTAACNLGGCPVNVGPTDPNTLVWGDFLSSSLTVNGHAITDQPLDTPFDAAQIIYRNGISNVDSDIFGATVTIQINTGGGISDFTDALFITTTVSGPFGPDDRLPDWVGDFGTPAGDSFHVGEEQQAQAELWGELIWGSGGIQFQPTSLKTNDPNGFIVSGIFAGNVPEPSTWMSMLLGFVLVGYAIRRGKTPTWRTPQRRRGSALRRLSGSLL